MTPVDLVHKEKIIRSAEIAADLASHYGASLVLVGVIGGPPGALAYDTSEYDRQLATFAAEVGAKAGIEVQSQTIVSPDPAAELDSRIAEAAKELEADLVVMASHKPGLLEYILPSHAGRLAAHSALSMFVVR